MNITLIPQLRAMSWHDGPPNAPLSRFGGPAPTFSRVPLVEALNTRHMTDAMAQDASSLADSAPMMPRISSPMCAVWGDMLYRRLIFADFDTVGHEPWSPDIDLSSIQNKAAALLMAGVGMPTAVYMTRAGLRAVWALDRPVPVNRWGWFTRWVEESGLREVTNTPDWARLGLRRNAVDVEECKSPVALFRLPYVHRDGVNLEPPEPLVVGDAPPIVADFVDADAYAFATPGDLGEAPEVPEQRASFAEWMAIGLPEWERMVYVPTSAEWARCRAAPEWPHDGPPTNIPNASGVRSTIASLAGIAVGHLAGKVAPDDIPAVVYAVLAPLTVACQNHPEGHDESAAYLWACLCIFASNVSYREAKDPEKPLIVAVAGEGGYRWRTPGGRYQRSRADILVENLRSAHRTLDIPTKHNQAYGAFGAHAHGVVYSFVRDTQYVPDGDAGGVLIENRAPLAPVVGEYSAACDEWLRLFMGDHYGAFTETLAGLRHLDMPCVAWIMSGENSTGKSMIAQGVAGQFGANPVSFDKAAQKHNDDLLNCPVIWIDEESRVPAGPSLFKELTGNGLHTVEPKNQNTAKLEGYLRLFVSTNVEDPMGFSRALKGEVEGGRSHRATAVRIRFVDVNAEAAEYLRHRGGRDFTEHWLQFHPEGVTHGTLTRHFRHLMNTAPQEKPHTRFISQDSDHSWLTRLTEAGGVETELLGAFLDVVLTWNGQGIEAQARRTALKGAIAIDAEGLFVRSAQLRQQWRAFMGDGSRAWKRATLNTALQNLDVRPAADKGARRATIPGWGQVRAYFVPLSALQRAADRTGLDHDVGALLAALGPKSQGAQ